MVAGNQFRHPANTGLSKTGTYVFVLGGIGAADLCDPARARGGCDGTPGIPESLLPDSGYSQAGFHARLGKRGSVVPGNLLLGFPRNAPVRRAEPVHFVRTA